MAFDKERLDVHQGSGHHPRDGGSSIKCPSATDDRIIATRAAESRQKFPGIYIRPHQFGRLQQPMQIAPVTGVEWLVIFPPSVGPRMPSVFTARKWDTSPECVVKWPTWTSSHPGK